MVGSENSSVILVYLVNIVKVKFWSTYQLKLESINKLHHYISYV